MKKTPMLLILSLLTLLLTSFTGAIQNLENHEDFPYKLNDNKAGITVDNLVKSEMILQELHPNNNVLDTDRQITSSEYDEENPVVDIGADGNYLLLYHYMEDVFTSGLGWNTTFI